MAGAAGHQGDANGLGLPVVYRGAIVTRRSGLSAPHVITDTMRATCEQVDGRFCYEQARLPGGRAEKLQPTEVGNEKLPPKSSSGLPRPALREAFQRAMAQYRRAGDQSARFHGNRKNRASMRKPSEQTQNMS